MRKLGISTIASVAVNVILSLWLVNQYFYDQYFHAYVDSALGPVYPFIVLTAGLGGGSSLGYLLLRRRHGGDEGGRADRGKLFKSGGPLQSGGNVSSAAGKILPTGPPPGQVSRHTAYAVPPLPKSSTGSSGGSRGTSPPSVSVASRTITPSAASSQRLEQLTQPSTSILNSTLRDQFRPDQSNRPGQNVSSSFGSSRGVAESTQPVNRIPPEPSRPSFPAQWKAEPAPSGERGFDSTVFPKPGQTELKPGVDSAGFGQAPKPPQAPQAPFPVSKWGPPEQRAEGQWTDPVPKPGLAAPQKWAPPPGQGFGPRPMQAGPPRPGAGPAPGQMPGGQRPPFPPGQGGPRPLGFPAPPRPGQPGPVGVAPAFRSDQTRPAGPPPTGRPSPIQGAPTPQPWNPPKPSDRADSGGSPQDKDLAGSPRPPAFGVSESPKQETKTAEPSSPGGEMDWDTALDTILKTLKKDRGVGEKT
ncbi:MAG TPA: hypothetical protein VFE96_04015 [Candidatus Bathyarchaeia archaeon]|nr:hypothetical protein [Candidatus Bathyarchaeia archaeon]